MNMRSSPSARCFIRKANDKNENWHMKEIYEVIEKLYTTSFFLKIL